LRRVETDTHGVEAESVAQGLAEKLETAWNDADGQAYGELFTGDADFVTIFGDHFSTGPAIGFGHQKIFDSIYAGSVIRGEVIQARQLDERVILAHLKNTLKIPAGKFAGEWSAMTTAVLVRGDDGWRYAAYHNTRIGH
jgi:uncharacterized protein (TIGR02246 family)